MFALQYRFYRKYLYFPFHDFISYCISRFNVVVFFAFSYNSIFQVCACCCISLFHFMLLLLVILTQCMMSFQCVDVI